MTMDLFADPPLCGKCYLFEAEPSSDPNRPLCRGCLADLGIALPGTDPDPEGDEQEACLVSAENYDTYAGDRAEGQIFTRALENPTQTPKGAL
jgi:hypothetical protein